MKRLKSWLRACSLLLIISFLCAGLASCVSPKLQKAIPMTDNEQLLRQKIGAYTALAVFMKGKQNDLLEYYFLHFGAAEPLAVDSKSSKLMTGIFLEFKNKKEIDPYFGYADKQPALDEADRTLKELYPKWNELMTSIIEADSYYKMKSYVDDDFAKGKELHRSILALRAEVKPLTDSFLAQFGTLLAEQRTAELNDFKSKNLLVTYYALNTIVAAREVEAELNRQGLTYRNVTDLDTVEFQGKYEVLVESAGQFLAYSKDAERLKQEALDYNVSSMDIFRARVVNLKAAATDILMKAKQESAKERQRPAQVTPGMYKSGMPEHFSKLLGETELQYMQSIDQRYQVDK
ncbi:DUF3829 domain-containing protein [Paenibacillus sp. y28]|uniref:DUF3829 domain-containing protein n=1 Tax=Paenibacillus sp. y28 TaxID=3129110 RepID=UPI0030176AE3